MFDAGDHVQMECMHGVKVSQYPLHREDRVRVKGGGG